MRGALRRQYEQAEPRPALFVVEWLMHPSQLHSAVPLSACTAETASITAAAATPPPPPATVAHALASARIAWRYRQAAIAAFAASLTIDNSQQQGEQPSLNRSECWRGPRKFWPLRLARRPRLLGLHARQGRAVPQAPPLRLPRSYRLRGAHPQRSKQGPACTTEEGDVKLASEQQSHPAEWLEPWEQGRGRLTTANEARRVFPLHGISARARQACS
mmetsp:Transcript_43981/g.102872  ORF Transcript_43981/g.102872 Transcript_43981/m.102872 type:complete len:217 (-) Transcript_43981:239-889(-)